MSWVQSPVEVNACHRLPLGAVPQLDPRIVAALKKNEFADLLAPQCALWEICCGGLHHLHDVCLCFPTGSGKTLAYVLPILNRLTKGQALSVHCLRALIVVPTKTLMNQVLKVMVPYCRKLDIRIGSLGQGEIEDEMEMLKPNGGGAPMRFDETVDVLLCTPGRLVTHLEHTNGFSLRTLKFLVLDEADHLMKRRHRHCLPILIERVQKDTQTQWIGGGRVQKIIVSATVSRDMRSLQLLELHAPRLVCPKGSMNRRYQFPEGLKHTSVVVPAPLRPLVLVGLLKTSMNSKTIIFCSTTDMSQKLTDMLSRVDFLNHRVHECSADLTQDAMFRSVNKFKQRNAAILVASDVMARGMDVDDVDQVISYDAPTHTKTYIHRVGRTARVDRSGTACCLLRKGMDEEAFRSLTKKLDINVEALTLDIEELKQLKGQVNKILSGMPQKRKRKDSGT